MLAPFVRETVRAFLAGSMLSITGAASEVDGNQGEYGMTFRWATGVTFWAYR